MEKEAEKKIDLVGKFSKKHTTDSLITAARRDALRNTILGWIDLGDKKLNASLGHPTLGIPLGRFLEICGGESHGKTAMLYYILGIVQKSGGMAVLFDNDGSFDEEWAVKLGLNTSELLFLQLEERKIKKDGKIQTVEEGMEDLFIKIGDLINIMQEEAPEVPLVIGWDDVTGTLTRKELEEEYCAEGVALAPRILSRGLKKLHIALQNTHISIIFINQFRTRIAMGYGISSPITTGGRALKYYATVRAKVARTGSRADYITCNIKNDKNKVAAPFAITKFNIHFEKGILLK